MLSISYKFQHIDTVDKSLLIVGPVDDIYLSLCEWAGKNDFENIRLFEIPEEEEDNDFLMAILHFDESKDINVTLDLDKINARHGIKKTIQ